MYVPPGTWRHEMMLQRQGHKQITIGLATNICNPIIVGYMNNKIV